MAQWFNKDFFKKLYLIFNPNLVLPKLEIKSLLFLEEKVLKSKNIKACIFDVNQTIISYDTNLVSQSIKIKIKELSRHFKCCILSNYFGSALDDPNSIRAIQIQEQLDFIPIIKTKHKKPSQLAFFEAIKILGIPNENIAVIGDRIFTDIIGANILGMVSILVKPIKRKSDPIIYVGIPRIIEELFLIIFKIFNR